MRKYIIIITLLVLTGLALFLYSNASRTEQNDVIQDASNSTEELPSFAETLRLFPEEVQKCISQKFSQATILSWEDSSINPTDEEIGIIYTECS